VANLKMSFNDKQAALRQALRSKLGIPDNSVTSVWIRDIWDDELVYELGSDMFRVTYSFDDKGKVTLGDPVKVTQQTSYVTMESLQAKYADLIQEVGKRGLKTDAPQLKVLSVCKEHLAGSPDNAQITEALKECDTCLSWVKEQAVTKTEDGESYPASAYAYVPDSGKPSEWKLRLWEDPTKKVTKAQLGRAAAALSPGGFRGQKVEIPSGDLSAVKSKIRSEYKKLDVPDEDIPKWVKEANMLRDYIHESIEIPIAEVTAEKIAKGIVPIRIIQPGFNSSKTRHYSESAVKDAVKIFEGAKQYANHATKTEEKERPERDIRDWVSTLENVKIAPNGNAVGEAHIHAGWFKEFVQGLFEAGTLNKLGASINSIGRGSKQKIDGVETFAVESLVDHPFKSVDFVTEAGAGGQVGVKESTTPEILDVCIIDLARLKEVRPDLIGEIESEYDSKNKTEAKLKMGLEEDNKTLKESVETLTLKNKELTDTITEANKAKAKAEAQAKIKEAVDKAQLPDAAKVRIMEQFKEAVTADGVDAAIKAEAAYIARLTESGKVKNLGPSTVDPKKTHEALVESFISSGMTREQAEIAANGR
jgi:hypothetical protein